jgi:hypothetical protein
LVLGCEPVTYQLRLARGRHLAAYEANHGDQVWFLANVEELEQRLSG